MSTLQSESQQTEAAKPLNFNALVKEYPRVETLEVGQLAVSKKRSSTFVVRNITTGLVIILHDTVQHSVAIAHMALPDSEFQQQGSNGFASEVDENKLPACYVNKSIPTLWEKLEAQKTTREALKIYMVGGSQLFTFGGGGGNPLNIGARNAIIARTTLGRLNLPIHFTDVGGNRPRSVLFSLRDEQLFVASRGGELIQV